MDAKILVIGGGGREAAISWKLAQSEKVGTIFVSPGNAGTEEASKTENVELDIKDHCKVAEWCLERNIDLVVVGPEAPLAEGKQIWDGTTTSDHLMVLWIPNKV